MNLLLLKTIWTLIETKYTWIKIKNHIKNSRSDSVTRWTWAFETERPRLNWREINWKYKRIIVRNLKSSIILQPALVFLQIFNKHPNITNNILERERERERLNYLYYQRPAVEVEEWIFLPHRGVDAQIVWKMSDGHGRRSQF